jgi:hypothetical protein
MHEPMPLQQPTLGLPLTRADRRRAFAMYIESRVWLRPDGSRPSFRAMARLLGVTPATICRWMAAPKYRYIRDKHPARPGPADMMEVSGFDDSGNSRRLEALEMAWTCPDSLNAPARLLRRSMASSVDS